MSATSHNVSKVQTLIEDLEYREISPEGMEELCTLLKTSPEVRRMYWDHMNFSALLHHEAQNLDAQNKLLPLPGTNRKKQRKAMVRAFSLAAAAIVALAVIAHFILVPDQPQYASYTLSPGGKCSVTHASPSEDQPDYSITSGSTVNLQSGELTIQIPGATTLYITAPASLHFKTLHELELHKGELWAASKSDKGKMTIFSGDYTITDIGTQFGVLQRKDKPLEVHLIEGEVEVKHKNSDLVRLTKPQAIALSAPTQIDDIALDIGPFDNPYEIVNIDFTHRDNIHGARENPPFWNELITSSRWKRHTWGNSPQLAEQSPTIPIKNSRGKASDIGVILVKSNQESLLHSAFSINDPPRAFRDPLLDDYLAIRVNGINQTGISASVILTGLKTDSTYSLQVFSSSKSYLLRGTLDHHDTEFRVRHKNGLSDGVNVANEKSPLVFDKLKPIQHETYGPVIILDWGWLYSNTDRITDWAILNGLILTEK